MEILCFTPCKDGYSGNEVIPGTKCQWYHYCLSGIPANIIECGDGLWFNPAGNRCDTQIQPIDCPPDPKCQTMPPTPPTTPPPTELPSALSPELPSAPSQEETSTTGLPTSQVTVAPTSSIPVPAAPNTYAPTSPPTSPPPTPVPTKRAKAMPYVESRKDLIESKVLVSYDGVSGLAYPSKQYTFGAFMQSLGVMGVDGFGADFKFLLYEFDSEKWVHGMVNLAAFLANCMVESIENDSCDELNWQNSGGKYPISNSCGQEGRSYEDENCVQGTTEFMSCDVDTDMYVTAVSRGTQDGAPPPLKCKPGSGEGAGYWDVSIERQISNSSYTNAAGRTDTEGCCWWGRGALLTHGVCNIGKINYYLGKRGAEFGKSTLFPTLDFCKFPEATCASANGARLRWITAMFEWSERVQRYETLPSLANGEGWNFEDRLARFVEGGMRSDSFITDVSRILSRGCHDQGCSELEVRMLNRRKSNFFMIIDDIFNLKSVRSTNPPTERVAVVPMLPSMLPPTSMPVLPSVPPPQPQVTMQPIMTNPMEMHQINPSPPNPTEAQEANPTPLEQPKQPPIFVDEATVVSNFACMSFAKQVFQLNVWATAMAYYYHIWQ